MICSHALTSTNKTPTKIIPLWSAGEVPLSLGKDEKDIPTLTPFWPDPLYFPYPCPAFIILPGGGYDHLAFVKEGVDYALFLNKYGIAGFVLTYRLGSNGYHYPAEYLDVERAIRMVRYHGKVGDWDVDPNRVGIMGSSAGGHLSTLALTRFDMGSPLLEPLEHVSSRPDLGVLCYPVIDMEGEYTHVGSRDSLLGPDSPPELNAYMSSTRFVTHMTPPTFLFHNKDDTAVPVQNSLAFDAALESAGVRHELHVYPIGGHGVGLGVTPYDPQTQTGAADELLPWTADLGRFLVQSGWAR